MDELWAVFSSPLAVTAGIVLVVYLYYRYLGCMYMIVVTDFKRHFYHSHTFCSLLVLACAGTLAGET